MATSRFLSRGVPDVRPAAATVVPRNCFTESAFLVTKAAARLSSSHVMELRFRKPMVWTTSAVPAVPPAVYSTVMEACAFGPYLDLTAPAGSAYVYGTDSTPATASPPVCVGA